jgi:hypothetical protein
MFLLNGDFLRTTRSDNRKIALFRARAARTCGPRFRIEYTKPITNPGVYLLCKIPGGLHVFIVVMRRDLNSKMKKRNIFTLSLFNLVLFSKYY